MVDFLLAGGKFNLRAAVDYGGVRAKPYGCARGIHSHVSAAHNYALLSGLDRGEVVIPEGLHKVVAGEEFVGGEHSVEVFARDSHKFGKAGACSYEHGLEAFLVKELVNGNSASYDYVGLYLYALGNYVVNLVLDHGVLWQTELGDAVLQHSAGAVESLEDGHVIAELGKVVGAGEA